MTLHAVALSPPRRIEGQPVIPAQAGIQQGQFGLHDCTFVQQSRAGLAFETCHFPCCRVAHPATLQVARLRCRHNTSGLGFQS
jgi:hypothetical protein